jgi:hypothetical protein
MQLLLDINVPSLNAELAVRRGNDYATTYTALARLRFCRSAALIAGISVLELLVFGL